jgi:hypothetical protein
MTNDDITEKKIIHKARIEKKAKLIREIYNDSDDELQDLNIRIRGYNRRSYIDQ